MKRGYVFLLLMLSFIACKQDGSETANGSKRVSGSAGIPVIAPDTPMSKILQSNIWMIEYYISSTDFENGKKNRGRWFIFKPDGTFQSGYWEKKTGSGSWYLTEGGKYPVLMVDSFNDAEDAAWEVQGLPDNPTEMSWVGAKDYPNYADMVKMFNMLTPPTKAQFGEK
ncbi:MAG: hypothetical protein ACK4TA_20615 [Saprospiraceae bacterium]